MTSNIQAFLQKFQELSSLVIVAQALGEAHAEVLEWRCQVKLAI